jgi:hypothetical protein
MLSEEGLEKAVIALVAEWSSYEEWLELIQNDREYRKAYYFIADSYNYLGILIEEGLGDIRLIALNYGTSLYFWETFRDMVYRERERRNNKRYCAMWEHFYNELVKYLEEHPELAP